MIKKNELNEADPQRNRVLLMVGIPYAGKSTEARRLSKKFGWPIVNPDAIRVALHGQRFLAVLEPWVWIIAHLMVKVLHLTGHQTVIVDACNVTRKRREEWLSESYDCELVLVLEETSEVCIQRAEANGDREIVKIIEKMAAEFELPAIQEAPLFQEKAEEGGR